MIWTGALREAFAAARLSKRPPCVARARFERQFSQSKFDQYVSFFGLVFPFLSQAFDREDFRESWFSRDPLYIKDVK
jgi:hypothetical protein